MVDGPPPMRTSPASGGLARLRKAGALRRSNQLLGGDYAAMPAAVPASAAAPGQRGYERARTGVAVLPDYRDAGWRRSPATLPSRSKRTMSIASPAPKRSRTSTTMS